MVDTTETLAAKPAAQSSSSATFEGASYAWFVVGALCVTNIVSFLERQIVTLMFGPIKRDFHVSDTQLSTLALAFSIFAVVFGLYFGRLADRKSRAKIITLGVIAWSAATMTCGLARNFMQLFVARVAVGVGEATLNSSALSMISDYFPRERLTRAISVYTSSVALGAGLALIIGGAIFHIVQALPPLVLPFFGQLADWQMTFFLIGLCGSAVLVPLFFVKEPPRRGVMHTSAEVQKKGVPFKDITAFLRHHWQFYTAHIAVFSIASISAMGALFWTPAYFERVHGWSLMKIGMLYGGALAIAATLGVLAGALISEWMDRRGYQDTNMRLPMLAIFIAGIPAIAAYFMPVGEWSIALIIVGQFIGGFATAPLMAALQLVTPNEMRGQVMAIFSAFAGMIGPAFGPMIVAFFTDSVYHNDAMVGWSLITTMLIVKPVVLVLFIWSLKPYRLGLQEANKRGHNVLPAAR